MTDETQYCQECGADLYSEAHILIEAKGLLDELVDGMNTVRVGRPMFALIIGDNGMEWCTSRALNVSKKEEEELFTSCLKDLIEDCNEE